MSRWWKMGENIQLRGVKSETWTMSRWWRMGGDIQLCGQSELLRSVANGLMRRLKKSFCMKLFRWDTVFYQDPKALGENEDRRGTTKVRKAENRGQRPTEGRGSWGGGSLGQWAPPHQLKGLERAVSSQQDLGEPWPLKGFPLFSALTMASPQTISSAYHKSL